MIAYFNSTIDTIKSAQTQVLSTVVTEEAYRKPLQSIIDAGADFVKSSVKATSDIVDQVSKFDYTKVTKK